MHTQDTSPQNGAVVTPLLSCYLRGWCAWAWLAGTKELTAALPETDTSNITFIISYLRAKHRLVTYQAQPCGLFNYVQFLYLPNKRFKHLKNSVILKETWRRKEIEKQNIKFICDMSRYILLHIVMSTVLMKMFSSDRLTENIVAIKTPLAGMDEICLFTCRGMDRQTGARH